MTEADDELELLLAAARAEFASRLDSKLCELQELSTRGDWAGARRAAHRLRGSAGTYGFPKIGAAAGVMEDILIDADLSPNDEAKSRFALAVAAARVEAEVAARGAP
jgi:HPt (histidine-containing phosphotransfer) domain-containing protein